MVRVFSRWMMAPPRGGVVRFDVLTLHPGLCEGPLDHSVLARARQRGVIQVDIHDMRRWAQGKHRQADDTPYGGGSGMVLRVDVVDRAIQAVRAEGGRVVLMDATGLPFDHGVARRLAQERQLVLVCGHYEGVDERVRQHLIDEALSVGDFVLTGGELPALMVIDAVARLVPGVLGNPDSLRDESFSIGGLEYPHFTRPREYRGWQVPEVLLSGHHARIQQWRAIQAERRTRRWRPDLLGLDPLVDGEE